MARKRPLNPILKPSGARIILASTSPRRRELLGHTGLKFSVGSPEIDESVAKGELPRAYCSRMAAEKAAKIWRSLAISKAFFNTIVIAADTSVIVDGQILGKPSNISSATRMLRKIQGRWHEVLTAVCVEGHAQGRIFTVSTRVKLAA